MSRIRGKLSRDLPAKQLRQWLSTISDNNAHTGLQGTTVVIVLQECDNKSLTRRRWGKARKLFRGTCEDVLTTASRFYIADKEPLSGRVVVAWFDENAPEAVRSAIEINERFMAGLNEGGVALQAAVGIHEEDALRTFGLATPHQVAYSRNVLPLTDIHTVPSESELEESIDRLVARTKSCHLRYTLPEELMMESADELTAVH